MAGAIDTDALFGNLAFNYAEFVFGTPSKFSTIAPLNPGGLRSGLIVRRKYLYTHPQLLGSDVELERDFFTKFNSTEYGTMYDNGEVKAYLSK